jgi:hypothetical protein
VALSEGKEIPRPPVIPYGKNDVDTFRAYVQAHLSGKTIFTQVRQPVHDCPPPRLSVLRLCCLRCFVFSRRRTPAGCLLLLYALRCATLVHVAQSRVSACPCQPAQVAATSVDAMGTAMSGSGAGAGSLEEKKSADGASAPGLGLGGTA